MADTTTTINDQTIYEQYDSESAQAAPDIEKLGIAYLMTTAGFTKEQSAILAQIIVSFVDDTEARHKRYFDSPNAGTNTKRDIENELREGGGPGAFLHRFFCWLLGRGDDFTEQLKPYLDEKQVKEIGDLFDKDAEAGQIPVAAAQDLLRGRVLLEKGNLAREIQSVIESNDPLDETKMPKCLRNAFATDLLSAEEAVAIKLLAFDLFAERVLKDEESRGAAPLCALFAAKASYDLFVSLKATIRTAQLEILSGALDLGGQPEREVR